MNKKLITNAVLISSDHAGFNLKEIIKKYLISKDFKVQDLGPYNNNSVDYPDYAKKLSKKINDKKFGILICGTGIGMSIMANRYKKIRASLVFNTKTAKLAREHNNANILVLGSRVTNKNNALKIVNVFFKTSFLKGRHLRRVKKFKNV
ncbi:MAG: ribose 5-phosphate isomerase B [Pelagibacteraceae bacterium]